MPEYDHVTITLPGNVSVVCDDFAIELIDSPEMQRLARVHQLGSAHFVYPGAKHTRLLHAIHAYNRMGEACRNAAIRNSESLAALNKELANHLKVAMLLHDIGHAPFSHVTEKTLSNYCRGIGHEDVSAHLIQGLFEDPLYKDANKVSAILDKYKFDKKLVSELILGKRKPLSEIIHGVFDIDYLSCIELDGLHTGIPVNLDIGRLMSYLYFKEDRFWLHEGAEEAARTFLRSKAELFKKVYYHKTTNKMGNLLSKMIDALISSQKENPEELARRIYRMDDGELLNAAKLAGGLSEHLTNAVKLRLVPKDLMRLEKDAKGFVLKTPGRELTDGEKEIWEKIDEALAKDYLKTRHIENFITNKYGLKYLIIAITPAIERSLAEKSFAVLTKTGGTKNIDVSDELRYTERLWNASLLVDPSDVSKISAEDLLREIYSKL